MKNNLLHNHAYKEMTMSGVALSMITSICHLLFVTDWAGKKWSDISYELGNFTPSFFVLFAFDHNLSTCFLHVYFFISLASS